MKELIKTKTFWSGLGLVGLGVVQITQGNQETGIQTVLQGLGLIFLRSAVNK